MTRALAALLALGLAAAPAQAQQPQPSKPLIKYGKWVLAAGAVGMNLLAARAHDRAEAQFDALETRCLADHARCMLSADGRYTDARSEELYQATLHHDREARRWLIGGETALLGAAAMFVWELTRRTPKPDNVPFEPELRTLRRATGIGVRVGF